MDKKTDARILKLKRAIFEAERFISRATAAITDLETESWKPNSAPFAAAKRSSLDLSKDLADLRRRRRF